MSIPCTGVVRGRRVELDPEVTLPEGTRVRVIPEETPPGGDRETVMSLGEWLRLAREGRSRRPMTSDSTDLVREMREGRAG